MNYKESEVGIIPKDWEIVTMEEALEKIIDYRGKTPKKSDSGILTLSAKSVKNGYIDYSSAYFISEKTYEEFMVRGMPKIGDILLTTEAPLGYVARLDRDDIGLAQRLLTLRGKKDYLYNDYLRYYLMSPVGQHQLKARESGTTVTGIKQSEFRKALIPIPPYKEQKAIGHVLSTLDEKIETNNQINEKLEEMAQALFKHWFVDFEFPNENGEPYKSSGGEMVESELGMIPKGWEVGKLGELVEISNKSIKPQEYPEKFFEHYSIPAFDNGRTPEIQKGEEIKSSKYVINNHMVLVSKLNPSTKRIWKPITQTNNAICSTEFIVYMAKKENILSYVFEFLNNEKFQGILTANATGSTGSRQRVKPKETLSYKVVLPPLKLMRQFSKIIEPMHLKIGSNMIENQKLKGLRDILLPKLMSGEIRVPLDNNEVDQS